MVIALGHAAALTTTSRIASALMDDFIPPEDVIRILNGGKISFVLVGAFGLAGWMRKRASEDVDVVVAARQVKKAVKLLTQVYPHLVPEDCEVVVRLRDPRTDEVVIDVMKPIQPPYRSIFKHTIFVEKDNQKYRIPSLEMALVCKFAPMISLMRVDVRKMQDAVDFTEIVKRNPKIDLEKLAVLGDLVYNGGGKEVVSMVNKVRAGEILNL